MAHNGHLVKVLHCCTDQTMTGTLASLDLTASQGRIIAYLAHCDTPPCPRDVEEAFQLTHPTVSGLLSRMEKKGFLELVPDPDDHRCKRIRLLPRGEQCHETMHRVILDTEARMVRDFTPEEREQFQLLLGRAIVNMGGSWEPPLPMEDRR